jgi:reactive intermediate/imine deaminase
MKSVSGSDRLESISIIAAALIVATALLISGRGENDTGEPVREIVTEPGFPADLPFAPAVRTDDLLFLSGQIGVLPGTMELVDGGLEAEARQTMENIERVLEAAGAGFDDLIKCTVFLDDIEDWEAFNEVYRAYFAGEQPARSAFGTTGLALGAAVEVECIAAVPDHD